jgi:hypothetical protein
MILAGAVSSSAGGFVATGGTLYTDGVWNHHVFNSSGTFQVASGEKNVTVYAQAGGYDGQGTNNSGNAFQGGQGGSGGNYDVYRGNLSSSLTVAVGAGGGNGSSITGASLSTIASESIKPGGSIQNAITNAEFAYGPYGFYTFYTFYWSPQWASGPQSGTDLKNIPNSPYTSLSAFTGVTTGGGGGAGRIVVDNVNISGNTVLGAAGGGGNGAISRKENNSTPNTSATNGAPNTGGGGGGGAGGANQNGQGGWSSWNTLPRGLGGSGRVVISYLVN